MTYQAIVTKYIGPSDTRGPRIKASCDAGSITIPFNHVSGVEGSHKEAFVALAKKFGWDKYKWRMGGFRGGYVFVLDED